MDLHELTAGYALDALDERERARYESHLATCDPCRDELEGFWRVTRSLAHAAAGPTPPSTLRTRILERARSERPNVVPLRRRLAVPALSSAAAVAALAALALGLWANSLSGKLDDTRGALSGNYEVVEILSDPTATQLPLEGADGRVVVSASGRGALVLSDVEPAPEGKTYEIWIVDDGTSRPAGLFERADTRTVFGLTRAVPDDASVAVTLENEGGVSSPTGPPLFATASA